MLSKTLIIPSTENSNVINHEFNTLKNRAIRSLNLHFYEEKRKIDIILDSTEGEVNEFDIDEEV